MDTHVALVGLSGTGKSSVAPRLARRWAIDAVDLDREIESSAGADVASLFATEGVDAFRDRESIALRSALEGAPSVIATGGGVVCREANRDLLVSQAIVVWLRAEIGVLVDRLSTSAERRPLLDGDAGSALRELALEREPLYRSVAEVAVDVTDKTRPEVVDAVASEVERLLARRERTAR